MCSKIRRVIPVSFPFWSEWFSQESAGWWPIHYIQALCSTRGSESDTRKCCRWLFRKIRTVILLSFHFWSEWFDQESVQ
jgi:hypothetical protein